MDLNVKSEMEIDWTVEDLQRLKGTDLNEISEALEIAKYGTKARKAIRILNELQRLQEDGTEDALEKVRDVQEIIQEKLNENGTEVGTGEQVILLDNNNQDAIGTASGGTDNNGTSVRSENSAQNGSIGSGHTLASGNSIDQLAHIFAQLTGVLQAQTPRPERIDDPRIMPQLPTFSGAEDTRYTTREWLTLIEQFANEFRWSESFRCDTKKVIFVFKMASIFSLFSLSFIF